MEYHTQVVSNVIGCAARKFFSIHKILVMRYFSIQTVKILASLTTILKAGCFFFLLLLFSNLYRIYYFCACKPRFNYLLQIL